MNRNRRVNLKTLSRTAKAIAMSSVLLTGCKMGPNYKQPAVSAPADFRFATTRTSDSLADLPWWEVFNDDALHHLIRTALSNNYDVRVAVNAAWEIDLWGRIRRLNESAQAQLLATQYAKRGVMLTLVSSIAQAYFQ